MGRKSLFCYWYPHYEKFVGMKSLFCCWYPHYESLWVLKSLFCCWYPRCGKFEGIRSLFRCWYPRYGKFEGMRSLFCCWYPRYESLCVSEACFVADTQIVKTGRYNKGIIYSRMPATGVRRITPKIRTVICEQAPNHGSYFAYARLIARVTLNLPYF